MIYGVYTIRDLKTGFMSITVSQNDQVAMRDFAHAINSVGNVINANPEDFDLFCLGAYDSENGMLLPEESEHRLVASGISLVKEK